MGRNPSPKLTIEIIPMSLHGVNPRTVNGKAWWDHHRRKQYEAAHYRCEICGGVGERHPVEAHERYEYDEDSRPPCQRLLGLIALCPDCHAVKHLYRTAAVSREQRDPSIYERALDHLAQVNGWDRAQVDAYLREVRIAFERRESLGPWTYDYASMPTDAARPHPVDGGVSNGLRESSSQSRSHPVDRSDAGSDDPGAMFEQATAIADRRHRAFFDRAGEVRQVWARRADGTLFYLADGGVTSRVRAAARAGELTCPYPDCPDPRFIAKGGSERRHHFAHQVAGQEHRAAAAWRHQALLMLTDWSRRRYPQLEVDIDDHEEGESLRLRSPSSGRVVGLTVTYDRRYELPALVSGQQLLVGHSRAILLPRCEADSSATRWWCGEGRLVGDLVAEHGWALAVNPQECLIATVITGDLARAVGLVGGRSRGELVCIIDQLEHARLDADGVHTPVSDAVDRELDRRRIAEAERERRRIEAEAVARARRAADAALERRLAAEVPPRIRPDVPRVASVTASVPVRAPLPERDESWPCDLAALRRLVGDDDLAQRLEQPLGSDVECDVPCPTWHLMAFLEWRKRGGGGHPLAIRAAIVQDGCGYRLTGEAIAGVLRVASSVAGSAGGDRDADAQSQ